MAKAVRHKKPRPSAEDFLPLRRNPASLRRAAATCRGCDLYKDATQTVFGEGPRHAEIMLIGEVPGDEEDAQGRPFVGPAGRLLDKAFDEAGLDRSSVYLTNAVKHICWEPRGKHRLHKKPSARHIEACKPWLHAEILVVKPRIIICLGATAAQVLLGSQFRVTRERGRFFDVPGTGAIMATYHPSAILRAPDKADREQKYAELVEDLRSVVTRSRITRHNIKPTKAQ
jgi:uracil-DNA glycosylase